MKNSIEIVLVLYHCCLEDSVSFSSLNRQLCKLEEDFELVIYNNNSSRTIENTDYFVVNSKENVKIAGAYNFALKRALNNGAKWLLLLDEDTIIPDNYFSELSKLFECNYPPDLKAIVPILTSGKKVLSPKKIGSNFRFEYSIKQTGYNSERINAFNSLSLLDVNFFHYIGGFPVEYPLDMHDHWCYHQIYKYKKKVYILQVVAIHNSSFVEFEHNVSHTRYKIFINAENNFIKNELGVKNTICYKIKLLLRGIKQFLFYKDKRFSLITISYIFR